MDIKILLKKVIKPQKGNMPHKQRDRNHTTTPIEKKKTFDKKYS